MITLIEGKTANSVWNTAAEKFQEGQNVSIQPSRAGQTREILHAAFTIKEPRQRWVTLRNPGINPAFAVAELVWIMRGRRDRAFVLPWNSQLPKYLGDSTEYHGAYGYRLRNHLGFDQLNQAYEALRNNQESRQVVLQIWDATVDLPNRDGTPRDPDIPCNIVSLLKIRDNRLEWTQILRSNDLFRGVPYNFIQFTTIQEIIAGWLDIEIGAYHHFSDSLHVYEDDLRSINSTLTIAEEENTDLLRLEKSESEAVFEELARLIEIIGLTTLSPLLLEKTTEHANLPPSYFNLFLLVAAEASRRNGWHDMVGGLMAGCTNPMLIQAWFRWISRFKDGLNSTGLEE